MIEWLQLITKRGSLDIDDLILNVLGVCLGYLIYPFFENFLLLSNRGTKGQPCPFQACPSIKKEDLCSYNEHTILLII